MKIYLNLYTFELKVTTQFLNDSTGNVKLDEFWTLDEIKQLYLLYTKYIVSHY